MQIKIILKRGKRKYKYTAKGVSNKNNGRSARGLNASPATVSILSGLRVNFYLETAGKAINDFANSGRALKELKWTDGAICGIKVFVAVLTLTDGGVDANQDHHTESFGVFFENDPIG